MSNPVFTVGHSTHSLDHFLGLLDEHRIQVVVDVRSSPYSRMNPQFNRESLAETLRSHELKYVFLGRELGARSEDPHCYVHDQVQYDRLAETDLFQSGITRIEKGAADYRMALTCAEKDPTHCHRTILVARHLIGCGLKVHHILADGVLEEHESAMQRLMESLKMQPQDLFKSEAEILDEAYERQAQKIAYRRDEDPSPQSVESTGRNDL